MNKNAIFIITCDTNKMTNECIESLLKHVDTRKNDIIVFDNGKNVKFNTKYKVYVVQNYEGQIINTKQWCNNNHFKWGIAIEHMLTVQWAIDNLRYDNMILLESDTIVLRDITQIIDENMISVGTPEEFNFKINEYENNFNSPIRIAPYLQFFNLNKMKEYGIHFINKHIGTPFADRYFMQDKSRQPDTGFYFYWSLKVERRMNLVKYIDYHAYIVHRVSGSWRNKNKYL